MTQHQWCISVTHIGDLLAVISDAFGDYQWRIWRLSVTHLATISDVHHWLITNRHRCVTDASLTKRPKRKVTHTSLSESSIVADFNFKKDSSSINLSVFANRWYSRTPTGQFEEINACSVPAVSSHDPYPLYPCMKTPKFRSLSSS